MGDLRIPNMLLFFHKGHLLQQGPLALCQIRKKSQCDRNQDDPPSLFRSTDCGGVSAPFGRSTVNQTFKDLLVEIEQNSHSCVYYAHDLFGLLFVFWVGCLVGWLLGWLVGWLVGWFVGGSLGRLVGWLVCLVCSWLIIDLSLIKCQIQSLA